MRARALMRLMVALQAFLLLFSLVAPGLVAATSDVSVSASLSGETVSVVGSGFGPDEPIDVTTTDPGGSTIDVGTPQANAAGVFTYSIAIGTTSAGTYSLTARGVTSASEASTTFEGNPPPADPPTDPPSDPPTDPPSDPPTEPPSTPPTDPPSVPPTDPPADPSDPPAPLPTLHFIVAFAPGTTAADRGVSLANAGATPGDSIPALNLQAFSAPAPLAAAVIAALRDDPSVTRVEADAVRDVEAIPSDSDYAAQWSLPLIGWEQAYGLIDPSGNAVVAVLDTGVDASHPDLVGQLVGGTSVLDGSAGTSDPNGHGTAMAGIIAAATDNGIGIAGIGYDGVAVMPVTVLGADGTGSDSDVIAGTVYAVDHGADVILMAFSNPGYSASLQMAIDYAWAHDVVIVAATGNDGSSSPTFPAGDRGVIGVSATDSSDALAGFSNFGQAVFLAAPGADILTTAPGGGTTSVTGTSASAAAVAAAAALVRANDSSATNGMIVNRLAESADAAGTAEQTGNGRLNLARTLGDASTIEIQPAGAAPVGTGGPFVGPYTIAASNFTVSVSPTFVGASTVSDLLFTYQGANGSAGSAATLVITAGWTAPQSGVGAGQIVVTNVNCTSAALTSIVATQSTSATAVATTTSSPSPTSRPPRLRRLAT